MVATSFVPVKETLGIRIPLSEAVISSFALACGLLVPMPTWALSNVVARSKRQVTEINLIVAFIIIGFGCLIGKVKISGFCGYNFLKFYKKSSNSIVIDFNWLKISFELHLVKSNNNSVLQNF